MICSVVMDGIVAANVSSLQLNNEPTHVGCYDETDRICRSTGGRLQMEATVAVRKHQEP